MRRRSFKYPARFAARHPVRVARNLVGNHSSSFADRYLRGLVGIEIGGTAHNDFLLDTRNVDVTATPPTGDAQHRFAGRAMPVDLVCAADDLALSDDAVDFVLASHVVEHMPDPFKALTEWTRVARRYVFLVIPQRTNPYDAERPLTTLDELIHRHESGFTSETYLHHWSVWTPRTFRELCDHLDLPIIELQDPDDKRGNGFAVLLDAGVSGPQGVVRNSAAR